MPMAILLVVAIGLPILVGVLLFKVRFPSKPPGDSNSFYTAL